LQPEGKQCICVAGLERFSLRQKRWRLGELHMTP
jgi:hypothetical protein